MIKQTLRMEVESPAVENFLELDGETYATGKDGKGLYKLIPPEKAYIHNEAALISEEFRYDKRKDLKKPLMRNCRNLENESLIK